VLVFDPENIPRDVLLEHAEKFETLHERHDGFAVNNLLGVATVMQRREEWIDGYLERLRNRISYKFHPVLEQALVLRAITEDRNIHHLTISSWRWEIGNKYKQETGCDPQEAQHLVSFCSVGYLDEDAVFDEIYDDLVVDGEYSDEDFRSLFESYVSESPFAVFVNPQKDSVTELKNAVTNRLDNIYEWGGSPGYVELCSRGKDAHDLAQAVESDIDPEYDTNITHKTPGAGQQIIRFNPDMQSYVNTD